MRKKFQILTAAVLATGMLLAGCAKNETPSQSGASQEDAATAATSTAEEKAAESVATSESADDILARAAEIKHDPENYTDIVRDVPYLDDGETYHAVDLYGTSVEESQPLVIEVHGGGFSGGNRENNTEHCVFFAERGYKVMATDYPRIPRHGSFVDAVRDLFTSYQWAADHAEEYGFDTDHVILSGDSAGGYYVLLSCAIMHSEELQEYFGVTPPAFEFCGYVTTCPEANLRGMQADLELESGPKAHMAQTIGADILLDEDLMSHLDLMQNVDPQTFEGVYMLTTPGDNMTGESVQIFDQYLTDNNVPHTTVSYEGAENKLAHTFNISHPEYPESLVANQDMVDYCNTLIQ